MDKVDIVIPVLNEAHVLRKSVETVLEFARTRLPGQSQVIIVDNGSTDGTQKVARELMAEHADVRFIHLLQRGRGRALRSAWLQSTADIVCYMDVDLSTRLDHLRGLVGRDLVEGYDVATGSRLMRDPGPPGHSKREFISRVYNLDGQGRAADQVQRRAMRF